MLIENYDIYSGSATKLFCTSWQPNESPKAIIFIVHGLGEHVRRYHEMAAMFVSNQIAVFSFDHRGHGQSDGKKGHATSVEQLIEDTEYALMKCRSIFLETPIFLFGHSMGGQIVATFLNKVKSKEICGAIISSAWLKLVTSPPKWQIKMINGIKRIFPSLTLSNGLDANHISTMVDEVELYQKDPLVHDRISFALFKALYNNGLNLLTEQKRTKVPVLICHGDADKITSHEAGKIYSEILGEMANFKSWQGSYHEPHHDKDKEQVFRYFSNWIHNNLKNIR